MGHETYRFIDSCQVGHSSGTILAVLEPHPTLWDSLAPRLSDDLIRDVTRDLGVAIELHGVHRATLRL